MTQDATTAASLRNGTTLRAGTVSKAAYRDLREKLMERRSWRGSMPSGEAAVLLSAGGQP